jgi:hypothetical protein
MADGQEGRRKFGGGGSPWHLLGILLVVEVVLDIVALPADEVLVPAEIVGDGIFVVLALIGSLANRPKGARQIQSSRRGVVGRGFRSNRRGSLGWLLPLALWGAFLGMAVYAWWFSIHHPILWLLLGLPSIIVTAIMGLFAAFVTVLALVNQRRRAANGAAYGGRQVGQ